MYLPDSPSWGPSPDIAWSLSFDHRPLNMDSSSKYGAHPTPVRGAPSAPFHLYTETIDVQLKDSPTPFKLCKTQILLALVSEPFITTILSAPPPIVLPDVSHKQFAALLKVLLAPLPHEDIGASIASMSVEELVAAHVPASRWEMHRVKDIIRARLAKLNASDALP
ncbi:hypothetical protein D9611_007968 [Ephemerocybe angulata]|uniref:Uncharacterized protein n=1 Tax=Ephemerocybe angulata TaxID=980116 RepID=A0A8H5CEM5_9AGAR|nr:hypothetical protein D9611_007968 [Tulosesus angulatus]